MRVATQRRIDRLAGGLLCGMTTWRARLLPRPEGDGPIRHVAVILLSEMGSLVLARPMFDRLRERYPDATLHAVVFEQNREVLDLQGVVPPENVLTLRNDRFGHLAHDARAATRRLRALPLDVSVDCELFARVSALLSWMSGARIRVGFDRHTQEGLYRGDLLNRKVLYNPYQHIAHQFVTLAEAIEAKGTPRVKRVVPDAPPVLERLSLPAADVEALGRRLLGDRPALAGRRLVLLSPSGGLLPIRAWPMEHWIDLGRTLLDDGYALGVIGLERDRPVARRLLGALDDPHAADLTGWTRSVAEVLLLFHHAALLVANDGGPGHFAALTPMPAVVLFGPETPVLYGTLDDKSVNLRTNLSCSPCLTAYNHRNSPCDGDNVCLALLDPTRVLAAARDLLARHAAGSLGAS